MFFIFGCIYCLDGIVEQVEENVVGLILVDVQVEGVINIEILVYFVIGELGIVECVFDQFCYDNIVVGRWCFFGMIEFQCCFVQVDIMINGMYEMVGYFLDVFIFFYGQVISYQLGVGQDIVQVVIDFGDGFVQGGQVFVLMQGLVDFFLYCCQFLFGMGNFIVFCRW